MLLRRAKKAIVVIEGMPSKDLKKYKQSIITEAVTKGLNHNVEMKDSEIEWINKIPKHWEVM